MPCRKNVKNLDTTEKSNFVNAVLQLKTKPSVFHPGNPNRSRYDDYVEIHMNAMMAEDNSDGACPFDDQDIATNCWIPGWAHLAPAFFPWHRVLLLQFENDLRSIPGFEEVTIPYWDWTDPAFLVYLIIYVLQ